MKLTLLGTGSFYVTKDRSSSAYLLEADGKKILVDCGPGTLMRLSQAGVNVMDIDLVLITHFHPDHTSDLFPFFMNFRLEDIFSKGKVNKFPKIVGPKGIYKFMLKYSKAAELLSVQSWNKIEFLDVKKDQQFEKIKVEAFRVKHEAFGFPSQAYAYRITIGKTVVTFSGDSALCPGLKKACNKADIFVCDASYAKGGGGKVHLGTDEIGELAQKMGVKKVILSHFYPQTNKIDLVKEVKEKYTGTVVRGKDLMSFDLINQK